MDDTSLTQIRCAIFDLDGTLVDSAPDINTSLNLMLQELNLPTIDLQQARNWMGNGADRLIKRALTSEFDEEPDTKLFNVAQELFRKFYDQHVCVDSCIFPGVIEGLSTLSKYGVSLSCITNKPRRYTPPLLRALELEPYFQFVICGDDLTVKKPDPQPLLNILRDSDFAPSQAIMVGDSESDMKAAKAANLKSFCVNYGYHQGKGVDALGADYIIHSIAEIPKYLRIAA